MIEIIKYERIWLLFSSFVCKVYGFVTIGGIGLWICLANFR